MTGEDFIMSRNEIIKAVHDGLAHASPSPDTKKFMDESTKDRDELRRDIMEQKFEIKSIKESQKEQMDILREIKDDIKNFKNEVKTDIGALEKKFAAKWTERGLTWMIMLIIGAVVTALLAKVII